MLVRRDAVPARRADDRALRVLLATAHPADPTLGSPKYLLRLGDALAALGHQVDFLFADDMPRWASDRRALYASFPLVVTRHALRARYDVVHVASGDAALAGPIAKLLPRRPWALVNLVLGMEHLHWKELKHFTRHTGGRLNLRHRILYGAIRLRQVELSIRTSDAVLCLCEQDRRFIAERGWLPGSQVAVAAPGVDECFLETQPASSADPNIFFLGTWTPRKGVHDLVRAFATVVEHIPDAKLVVAGAHAPAERVLADFPSPLRSSVTVLPTIDDPPMELIAKMRGATVGVLPSHYEGFGMAFLEMMALGLPVVGTPTGGMADLLEDGVNGIVVPPRSSDRLARALTELLGDSRKRRRLAVGALRTARAYTWRRAAEAATDLYSSVLKSR